MGMRFSRSEVLLRLQNKLAAGHAVIAAGAGTGISAKCEEKGGVDLIMVYNSGRFRMSGLPSVAGILSYGDANEIVMQMGERQILPVVRKTPVIAGVNGTDPTRSIERFLEKVKEVGFAGVINFPTVAVFDGNFRRKIESLGLGYSREIEMLKIAKELDLFTMAYAFTSDEAVLASRADIDVVVAHMGTTMGGSVGVGEELSMTIDSAIEGVREICRAVKNANRRPILLIHGGPFSTVENVARALESTDAAGFVGASSIERVPVEEAIEQTTRSFCSLKIRRDSFDKG